MSVNDVPPFIGDWHQEKKLGSGGFGVVTLWKNPKTKQSVAIKRCHLTTGTGPADPTLDTQRERWNREVDYMTNHINNENIVRGIKIEPASFLVELNRVSPSTMPTLVMEYCEGGDLRRMLNANQATSGFTERDVRSILKCLGNAISYLHTLKITHRDIKPENIVVKCLPGGVKVYKLTDLGYAKPLDRNSLVASLVGTLEYIAPELCFSDRYSNTVDYWSFGIIAAEIISGSRPFVPHMPMTQWVIAVRKKKSDEIRIYEGLDDVVHHSNQLPDERRVSKCFARQIEPWLRLALEWNPKQRGHIFESSGPTISTASRQDTLPPIQVLKIFTMLDAILKRRVLTVFCLHTYQDLSYDITESMAMAELRHLISSDTQIPAAKIRFIVPIGNDKVDNVDEANTLPVHFHWDTDKPMVYVTQTDEPMRMDTKPKLPTLVEAVMSEQRTKFRPHIVKQFAYNAFHFVRSEQQKYVAAIEGMHCYALRLNHDVEIHESEVNRMIRLVYGLEGAGRLLAVGIDQLEQNLKNQSNDFITQCFHSHDRLAEECAKLSANITSTVGACEQIAKRYKSVQRRSRLIVKDRLFDTIDQDYFGLAAVDKAFTLVREELLRKVVTDKQHMGMFKCVYNCLRKRDQLLRDKDFIAWHSVTAAVSIEMAEIGKTLEKAIVQAEKYQLEVQRMSDEHQTKLWKMVNTTPPPEYLPDIDRILMRNGHGQEGSASAALTSKVPLNVIFKIGQPVSNADGDVRKNGTSSLFCFGEGDDASSLMHDNEKLRLTFSGLMDEMSKELQ